MKISNITIKEALSLLRLGFSVEQIIELDKELGGETTINKGKKKQTAKKRTIKKITTSKKGKSPTDTDENILEVLLSIKDKVNTLDEEANKINP